MDILSNTDPFAVIFIKDNLHPTPTPCGRTEVIMDTQTPSWTTQILLDYHFEMTQELTVKIFDQDNADLTNLSRHDFCGQATFSLSSLMCSSGQSLTLSLLNQTGGPAQGNLVVRGEPASDTQDLFVADFVGKGLTMKNGIFWGASDPFLIFSRLREDGSWLPVHRTSHQTKTLNPRFPRLTIPMLALCNGDLARPIRVEVLDYEDSGRHQPMGQIQTSVQDMLGAGGRGLDVIEPEKKKASSKYTNSGTFSVQNALIERRPTLTQFLAGGCEISLMVAIDFTASNQDPVSPSSLHYRSPTGALNQYQQAILSVGGVLDPYDYDHLYPVYGFGAKVRLPNGGTSNVQHCFPVYGGGVEVQGVQGIMQAYSDALPNVILSGPTLFAPIIEQAAATAQTAQISQQHQKYFVLLILTDGEINDMDNTARAIIRASRLPLSIIIVGVGSADFTSMNVLDGDGGLLKVGSEVAVRDIVQFVAFRDFSAKGSSVLAQEVLAEVPAQLLKFFTANGIVPNPPR